MTFRNFRIQLVLRGAALAASGGLAVYLAGWTDLFYAPLAVGLAVLVQVADLVRYAEKATRDVRHFVDAIRQADFSQGLSADGRGPLFEQLSGAYAGVMETFREVRAEREEHFRYLQTVVHHVGVALLAFRDDGGVALVNTAARRLLGPGALRDLDDVRRRSEPLAETLAHLRSGDHAVVRVADDEHDLQLVVYATEFQMRGLRHKLVSLHDIGSELEAQELAAWQKLTRVLTHEIMNSAAPIASLAATAGTLLARDAAADEAVRDTRDALEAIQRRSEALMHFVDSYRSFTQIRRPDFRVFAVRDLLRQVERLFRVQAAEKGIALEVHVDPDGLSLTADEELVEQVLINLLLNAMDAVAGRDGARVTLRARLDRYGRALVQVVDNGPGIPPDLQERIFIPFFTTRTGGSGIGLSLSRQILRLHGGSLGVRSEPGVETVFTLRF